jgi:hypothetical protein
MNDSDLAAMWSMEVTTTPKAKEPLEVPATKMNETELAVDSAAVRWAARLVYCAMAPFVLVGGLLVDLHSFNRRVVRTAVFAFGGDESAADGLIGFGYGVIFLAFTLAFALATTPGSAP